MRIKRRIVILFIIVSLFLSGCSTNKTEETFNDRCYSSTSVFIDNCDMIIKATYQNNSYYLFTDYYDINDETGNINNVITCYTFDEEKVACPIAVIDGDDVIDLCLLDNGNLAVLKRNEIRIFNVDLGEYEECPINESEDVHASGNSSIYSCENGFVVIADGKAILYSEDGSLISFVDNELLCGCVTNNGYWGDNETAYVAMDRISKVDYLAVSWENGYVEKITDSDVMGIDYQSAINGIPYSVNGQTCDVYRINLDESQVELYASGKNMLIPPTSDGFSGLGEISIVDEKHLLSVRSTELGCEIIFIEEDDSFQINNREIIKIGCTDVINSPSIKQAVYLYNSSQEQYWAVIEEYELDYSNLTNSLLEIISRFNNGDTPDIFCGNYFNYDAWGRSGMVIDLSPYIGRENEMFDSIVSAWTDQNGSCYSVFPSFSLSGFFSTTNFISTNELSISDITDSVEGQSVLGGCISSENLAYYTIVGEIQNTIVNGNDSEISIDSIANILVYATTYGLQSDMVNYINFEELLYEDVMLVGHSPYGLEEFLSVDEQISGDIIFVGYPSIEGGNRIIIPNSQVAVSSGTQNLQACVEFINVLFSNEVQEDCILNPNCGIPVIRSILEDYAIGIVEEKNYEQESFQDYLNYVNSGNVIFIDDNGLCDIVIQELDRYYDGVPIEQVSESLASRINIYISENY